MPPAALPPRERDRLAALRSYDILDTADEETFNDIVALATRLTEHPVATVSFVDGERMWFKARQGTQNSQEIRDNAFCAHAILTPDRPLVVEDATADPRFADNPLVTGEGGIRAYLGVPLVTPEGHALGALCVVDRTVRRYDAATIGAMQTLARAVSAHLELRRAVLTDTLTGLLNRRAMIAALRRVMAARDAATVITIDLDGFREVNDAEGHAAGDTLLLAVADRLRECIRREDVIGRLGDDEFAVVLAGVSDRAVAGAVAQRISTALHGPVVFGARQLRLGATLGVAVAPVGFVEPELALRTADEALMQAKRECRGSVGWASQADAARLRSTAAIIRAFDAASTADDLIQGAVAYLQPIVRLGRDGTARELVALEALARWRHADVGEIPPGDLFPAIGPERATHLGRAVREQALAVFAQMRLAGARLALNLSPAEVLGTDTLSQLEERVERAGLSLGSVEIEITEEVLLDKVSDRTLDHLATLRRRGARLVLDDFGTGHSGLSQLLRLPLDGLKLDKRFVQRLGMDSRAGEIVRATLSLAHGMGLDVVAEGIETERQAVLLRGLGCSIAQGFLFARPMAPAALRTWLSGAALACTASSAPPRTSH